MCAFILIWMTQIIVEYLIIYPDRDRFLHKNTMLFPIFIHPANLKLNAITASMFLKLLEFERKLIGELVLFTHSIDCLFQFI